MDVKTYTVLEIINLTTNYLNEKQIENARLNAELLIGHVLNLKRVQLYLNFEKPLRTDELDLIRQYLKRRGDHEPLQYILGEAEFYSLRFKLNKYTLIPRPETELLVELVVRQCKEYFKNKSSIKILDIGTGSGNIAIALAKELESSLITAIDVQTEALKIANENAEYHEVTNRIDFVEQNILFSDLNMSNIYDVIVSNPPYISTKEFEELPEDVKLFEPAIALNGGDDGLIFYKRFTDFAKTLIQDNGFVALEIGARQADDVLNLFKNEAHFSSVEIMKDLNQLPRILFATK